MAKSRMQVSFSGKKALAALLSAAIVFILYVNVLLYHFYIQGAFMLDTGAYAGAMWHRDWRLLTSPMFTIDGFPLFATHMMLIFSWLNVISWCLPFTMPVFFSGVIAAGHALPVLGIFLLLSEGLGLSHGIRLGYTAVVSIAFGLSGIPIAIIRFPHPEILLAGGAILFCAALALGRRRQMIIWFVFTLLVREDAGFHLCGLLIVLAVTNIAMGRSLVEQRSTLWLAATGFCYSALVLAIQWLLFHGAYSTLRGTYLGDPPFHDMSWHLIGLRLIGLPLFRPYVVYPAMIAFIWARLSRNPLIVVGYLAFTPWLLLQLVATNTFAGTLSGYYAFPFLIASAWPLAGVIIKARREGRQPGRRGVFAGFTAMVMASFLGLSGQWDNGAPFDIMRGFTTIPSPTTIVATDHDIETIRRIGLEAAVPVVGTLLVDGSIVSLAPYGFRADQGLTLKAAAKHPDTVAYFSHGPELQQAMRVISQEALGRCYQFDKTAIRLASNRDLSALPGLGTGCR